MLRRTSVILAALLLVASGSQRLCAQTAAISPEAALAHANELLSHTPLIDGHNDLPWVIREDSLHPRDVAAYDIRGHVHGMTDFPRIRTGHLAGQFWSIYIPGEDKDSGYARVQLEQFDIARRMIAQYPDQMEFVTTADGIENAWRHHKFASLLGMEGGHAIENSLGALRAYYDLGARYMTLTHNVTLDWADAALDSAKHGGLTPFGKEVVREMNRLGMLVDISHVSPETMHDALRVSRAPVIASHSSAYAIAQHARNVPDDVLKRIAENGGVVMVNFFSGFVEPASAKRTAEMFAVRRQFNIDYKHNEAEVEAAMNRWRREHPILPGTVHTVVDHIDHIVKMAGIDHVGLGSDYDGVSMTPLQLEDVSCYPYITQELLNRGYDEGQIQKILGRNVLRALRRAEEVAGGK
jgi:membrane dipeptidase